jgi:hypothetical protein
VSTAKDPAYWQALGEFIEAFSSTGTLLFNYLAGVARTPHAIAKALFGGDHVDELIKCLKQVIAVRPLRPDISAETTIALTQLKIISNTRNSVVHYASFVLSDKGRVSSNITRAKRDELIVEYRASVGALKEMTSDLERISQLILYCWLATEQPSKVTRDQFAGLPAPNAAWLYKQALAP